MAAFDPNFVYTGPNDYEHQDVDLIVRITMLFKIRECPRLKRNMCCLTSAECFDSHEEVPERKQPAYDYSRKMWKKNYTKPYDVYHPLFYMTKKCNFAEKQKDCPKGPFCPYFHGDEVARTVNNGEVTDIPFTYNLKEHPPTLFKQWSSIRAKNSPIPKPLPPKMPQPMNNFGRPPLNNLNNKNIPRSFNGKDLRPMNSNALEWKPIPKQFDVHNIPPRNRHFFQKYNNNNNNSNAFKSNQIYQQQYHQHQQQQQQQYQILQPVQRSMYNSIRSRGGRVGMRVNRGVRGRRNGNFYEHVPQQQQQPEEVEEEDDGLPPLPPCEAKKVLAIAPRNAVNSVKWTWKDKHVKKFLEIYKTSPCKRHCNIRFCIYYHDEEEKRRSLSDYKYEPVPCINIWDSEKCCFDAEKTCRNKELCEWAHNFFEIWWHWDVFKTKKCPFQALREKNAECRAKCEFEMCPNINLYAQQELMQKLSASAKEYYVDRGVAEKVSEFDHETNTIRFKNDEFTEWAWDACPHYHQ